MEKSLIDYANTVYSQHGEDGVLEEIFNRIGCENKTLIDIGAADGLWFSNTASFWKDKRWKALLVEGDPLKHTDLTKNAIGYPALPYLAMVHPSKEDLCIDSIIKKTGFPDSIDLLSIDIDGDDYFVFQEMRLSSNVVVIEHHPQIPYPNINVHSPDSTKGSSVRALELIANQKGYSLACVTFTNSIFISTRDEKYFKDLNMDPEYMHYRVFG